MHIAVLRLCFVLSYNTALMDVHGGLTVHLFAYSFIRRHMIIFNVLYILYESDKKLWYVPSDTIWKLLSPRRIAFRVGYLPHMAPHSHVRTTKYRDAGGSA